MKNELEEILSIETNKYKKNWNSQKVSSYKLSESEIREIFATSHEVNLDRDEYGMPIPGTGRLITNEEKKNIFDFILENKYPLTRRVYNLVLQAYINNEVEIEKKQGPKL